MNTKQHIYYDATPHKIQSNNTETGDEVSLTALRARGRLSDAKKYFMSRGWTVLPQGIRGQRILEWGAAMAYLAAEKYPERSVRRWCRRWWPSLRDAELDELVARVASPDFNKRWSDDECAAVLDGITMLDRITLGLRFIGCVDDPDYKRRNELSRAKHAARSRKHRAANSTGAKPGRPRSDGPKPWEVDGVSKATYYRHKSEGQGVRLKPRAAHNLLIKKVVDINIGGVTQFQSHSLRPPDHPSRPRQASRREALEPITVYLDDEASQYPEIIINDDGTFDWADPEHAPFAVAAGRYDHLERRAR